MSSYLFEVSHWLWVVPGIQSRLWRCWVRVQVTLGALLLSLRCSCPGCCTSLGKVKAKGRLGGAGCGKGGVVMGVLWGEGPVCPPPACPGHSAWHRNFSSCLLNAERRRLGAQGLGSSTAEPLSFPLNLLSRTQPSIVGPNPRAHTWGKHLTYFIEYVLVALGHVWLSVAPWTIALQAPPSMGFSRQEYWSRLPFPSPRGSSQPRDHTWVFCIGRWILFFFFGRWILYHLSH